MENGCLKAGLLAEKALRKGNASHLHAPWNPIVAAGYENRS